MRYSIKKSTAAFRITTDEEGCRAEHLTTPLDVSDWLHSHDGFELYFNVYGGKSLIIGEEFHALSHGSVVLIRPNDLHGHYFRGTLQAYERASVYFSAAYLQSATHGYLTAAVLQDKVERQGHFFILDEPQLLRALQIIGEIQSSFDKCTPLEKLRTATALSDILLLFLTSAVPDKGEAAYAPPVALLMHSVMTYINDHFTSKLTLASIARRFAISRSYLSHLFTEYCGSSVYDYVQQKRIIFAKQLIDRNEGLTTVAVKCGFQDYSCFLRAFTKRVGCSPNRYRKHRSDE